MRIGYKALVAALVLGAAPLTAQQLPASNQIAMKDGDAMLRAFRERVLLDTLAVWSDVPGKGPEVYARAKAVLEAMKLPITQTDSTHGILWNEGFATRGGRLAGKANSQLMRCGFGPTGDHADQWRVTAAYAVYVRDNKDGSSKIGIALLGQAKDIAGAASPAVLCNTKGVLENEIIRFVREGMPAK
jgi:hypothetical protein